MSIITGNINLNNVNIRPDKVNELFAKKKLPIALKAGMISKLHIKLNLLSLFSDSLKVTVEDILFIVGPNISHMSQESDFDTNINSYDENNPMNNFLKMHQKVKKQLQEQKQEEREKAKADKVKQKQKLKEKLEKKKKEATQLKEPPMKIIISLLGGLKLEVKRIHFRYEDDYFQHHRPFAFGLMIEQILMDNSDTDWTFDTPLSMGFVRNRPFNSNTVNKELNIKNVKAYWNSMSEMFVPTSLWEQTRHLKYQIFEAMDASFLKDIMIEAFGESSNMNFNYLLAPFTIYTSINLNKSFKPQEDPYKYQINSLISQINLNLNPNIVRDILKFQSFLEMSSYVPELKRFRPLIRIQSFVDSPAYTPAHKKKRAQLIKDWFQFVLWYVRLRRAGKGQTPFKLLEMEELCQKDQLQNVLLKIKKARLEDYHPYYGSDDDEEMHMLTRRQTDLEIDVMQQYEKQEKEIKTKQFIRDLLGGFKLNLKIEGVKAKVFTNKKIKRQHQEIPTLEFDMGIVAVLVAIQNQHIIAKILLKEIKLLDYYKHEQIRAFSRQVHNVLNKNGLADIYNNIDDRGRITSQQFEPRASTISQPKKSQAGIGGMLNSWMGGGTPGSDQATPYKKGLSRLTDIIYGSNNDRSAAQSRQLHAQDYFSYDIPDPGQAHSKTRETLTISDIFQNQPRQSNFIDQTPISKRHQNDNVFNDMSPARPSRIVKASKFQSPLKVDNSRQEAMKHVQLNQRSEIFVDDYLESVEKRCFFLMCGKTPTDSFISIDVAVNVFDAPGVKQKISLSLTLDQIIIEYCNEILKSLTNLGLQYKIAFNFADLKNAPGKNKINNKRCLSRMLELQAPLFAIKKLILKRSLTTPLTAVIGFQKHFYIELAKQKSHALKQKELKAKQLKMVEGIQKIDKQLHDLNFDIIIALNTIYLGLTGDKDDPLTSNQTLLEFGIDNQNIKLNKEDFKCKVSVFGISITTLNTFEMLFTFANKLQKVASMYKDNVAIQASLDNYKEFIKNIQKHREKENKLKKIEEEKELQKKSSQPRIVIMEDQKSMLQQSKFQPNNQIKINQEYSPNKHKVQFLDQDKLIGTSAPKMNNGPTMGGPVGKGNSENNLGLRNQATISKDHLTVGNAGFNKNSQDQLIKGNPKFNQDNDRNTLGNNGPSGSLNNMRGTLNPNQYNQNQSNMQQRNQVNQQQNQRLTAQMEEEFKDDSYDQQDVDSQQQDADDSNEMDFEDNMRVRNQNVDDFQYLAQQRRR